MKLAIVISLVIPAAAASAAAAIAGEIPSAPVAGGVGAAPLVQVAFGDGPETGKHHGRKRHGADTPKDTGPSQIDMHGATREGADQEYRKKYGF